MGVEVLGRWQSRDSRGTFDDGLECWLCDELFVCEGCRGRVDQSFRPPMSCPGQAVARGGRTMTLISFNAEILLSTVSIVVSVVDSCVSQRMSN